MVLHLSKVFPEFCVHLSVSCCFQTEALGVCMHIGWACRLVQGSSHTLVLFFSPLEACPLYLNFRLSVSADSWTIIVLIYFFAISIVTLLVQSDFCIFFWLWRTICVCNLLGMVWSKIVIFAYLLLMLWGESASSSDFVEWFFASCFLAINQGLKPVALFVSLGI